MIQYTVKHDGPLTGHWRVPGDKSISHRSLMLGALSNGTVRVSGFLDGADCLATRDALKQMGVRIEGPEQGKLIVHGVGLNGLTAPKSALYVGNSGTSMRLFAGLLAGQPFDTELSGDASLNKRPMARVIDPLRAMGAIIEGRDGKAPLKITGGVKLKGNHHFSAVASAQVKSCLLLAGLYAEDHTCITEPALSRDHTERMLQAMGYPIEQGGLTCCIDPGGTLQAVDIEVPADISSAAFFMVGACLVPGSDIVLEAVGINPSRIGIIHILKRMGADITYQNERQFGQEPVADIRIKYAPLKGCELPPEWVPLAIDEFPAVFVAAACAEGETRVTGAEELRVKESDRIQAMADGLQALGIQAEPLADGMRIQGGALQSAEINSHGDHRIAMAFAMAGLAAAGEIVINDCKNVDTSFPGFIDLARQAGLNISSTESS